MKRFVFAFILFTAFSLISCSKKMNLTEHNQALYDFSYELADYNFEKKSEASKYDLYYFPPCLKKFLFHQTVKDGCSVMLIEFFHDEKKGELEAKNFYSGECDNGAWVEEFLILMEESRIADEISELEDLLDEAGEEPLSYEENSKNQEKETDKTENIEDLTEAYRMADGELTSMEVGKEIFIPEQTEEGRVLIHASKNDVLRSVYDESLRLIKTEKWNITSFVDSALKEQIFYTYESQNVAQTQTTETLPEETKPVEEKSFLKEKTVISEGSKQIFEYNSKSSCVKYRKYNLKNSESDEYYLVSQTVWTYNEQNELLKEETNDYAKESSAPVFTKVRKLSYNQKDSEGKEVPPDVSYYENGTLKMKTTYSSSSEYIMRVFFENDFSVVSYYENDKKVKDVYAQGRTVIRTKEYE